MRFNASAAEAAKAGGSGFNAENVIKMKDLEEDVAYKFRVLEPIVPVLQVMYPCLVPDDQNPGQLRQSWRSVRLPLTHKTFGWEKEPTVVDTLRKVDLGIRNKNRIVGTTEKITSLFEPRKLFILPVFDRQDPTLRIKYFEVGWQIFDGILKLRTESDEDKPHKLAFGPHWIHDVVIRKTKKEGSMPDRFKTVYTVKPAKNHRFAGMFDSAILKEENLQALLEQSVKMEIFTEDEYAQVMMFSDEAEMLPLYRPNTPDEVLKQFNETPICLDAKNNDGAAVFPYPKELAQALLEEKIIHGQITSGLAPMDAVETPEDSSEDESTEAAERTEAAPAALAEALETVAESVQKEEQPEPAAKQTAKKKLNVPDKLAALMDTEEESPIPKKAVPSADPKKVAAPAAKKKDKPKFVDDFEDEV